MEQHGLLKEDNAFHRYKDFETEVMNIVKGERFSEMKPKSVSNIKAQFDIYSKMDEASFLAAMIPLILKDSHQKHITPETLEEALKCGDESDIVTNPRTGVTYQVCLWFDDGILARADANLLGDLLPDLYADNDLTKRLTKEGDDMKTPRPDRIFGLDPKRFAFPKPLILDQKLDAVLWTCKHMHYPFFLIEGKSNRGNGQVAENQARRGGATIVNAMRCAYSTIGQPKNTPGPDNKSFIFSATINAYVLDIWLHWALITEEKDVLFHMDLIHSVNLKLPELYPNLRIILHNIFGWGCDYKKRGLLDLHEDMIRWQRVQSKQAKPSEISGSDKASGDGGGPNASGKGKGKEAADSNPASAESTPGKPPSKKHKHDDKCH